jgi:lipid-A-disaccharide synthase
MANGAFGNSILLIAGDVSGDVHIAALARTLLARDPDRTLYGLGGRRLRAMIEQSRGGRFLADTTNCSAIGIISALKVYFRCRAMRDQLYNFLRDHPVDLAILCDWGGFNGRILPHLHSLGIPVLYYFPPRSWDRNAGHGMDFVPYVRRVATPFPWSAERLRAAGAEAEWVGHPSLEKIPAADVRPDYRRKLAISPNESLVALLPGSRLTEIRILAPRMAAAAALVKSRLNAKFVAVVPRELAAHARKYLPSSIGIVTDCAMQLLAAADAAVVKTGTSTLEALLVDVPQVTVYDFGIITRIEWCLLWAWRRIPFVAMPNIILQREAVPELLGLNCKPGTIADWLIRLQQDESTREKMRRDYSAVREALGSGLPISASERTAQIAEEMLDPALATVAAEPVAA